jgi:hypothetical protein
MLIACGAKKIITIMGKDKSGGFHPAKGKPTAINKEEGLGIPTSPSDKVEEFLELSDTYTDDDQTISASIPVRHPNRNVSKKEQAFKNKDNKPESDKTVELAVAEEEVKTEPEELPGVLEKELFVELANYKSSCCASIYFKTHQAGVEVNEKKDAIQFKNILQELRSMLVEKEIPDSMIDNMLTPGFELLKQDDFWANLSPGLAVFISEGYFKYIKLPFEVENETICNTAFYVTPLVPVLARKEYFYLLVITKHNCKLFRADAFGMEYINVPGLPESMEDVKDFPDKDSSTFRAGGRGGNGGANFHGIGGGNPEEKDLIAAYFEAVDDVLFKEIFNKENAPLLLAGVEYLIPIYRSVCDYHNVYSEALTGSHEHDIKSELYKLAKEVMQPYFLQAQDKALTIYANQSATELTSSIPADVIPAAYYGRLSHIFIQKNSHIWGTFDENTTELALHDSGTEDSEDLADQALVKTLMTGGEVYLLEKEEMPADSAIAGVFRY